MKSFCVILVLSFASLNASSQDSLVSIYFGGGSYFIDEVQVEELQQFIGNIDHLENYELIIFSHTDNIGSKEYNEWLSQMRSRAVIHELIGMDVPAEMIKIRNFGLSNPLYKNTSHNGRVMNRRVDVILWPLVF